LIDEKKNYAILSKDYVANQKVCYKEELFLLTIAYEAKWQQKQVNPTLEMKIKE
jgi:hypothetical protein